MRIKHDTKLRFVAYASVILIPLLLALDAFQAHRYAKLKSELAKLGAKQIEIVEQNRKLISVLIVPVLHHFSSFFFFSSNIG